MDPHRDPDNNVTWDAFFTNRWEREFTRYEGEEPPSVHNNEASCQLWWSGQILESVMEHITITPACDNPTSS
jgi:hypothetical protein